MSATKKHALALYNLLDGFCGMVSEQGWEGVDRYYNKPFDMFIKNLSLLSVLDKDLGDKLQNYCVKIGIIELNKENK